MKIHDDDFILSTGKIIDSHCGILGMNYEAKKITYGYDGNLWSFDYAEDLEITDRHYLTKEELIEISDYMIAKWNEFKSNVLERIK